MCDIKDYLLKERSKINLDTKKAQHNGLYILAEWEDFEDVADRYIFESLHIIKNLFKRVEHNSPHCMETAVKVFAAVGRRGLQMKGEILTETKETQDRIQWLGGVVVEAFDIAGKLYLERSSPYYTGHQGRCPANVFLETHAMNEQIATNMKSIADRLQNSILLETPTFINSLKCPYSNTRIIKNAMDEETFETMKQSNAIIGADIIQQTPWKINQEILTAGLQVDMTASLLQPRPGITKLQLDESKKTFDEAVKEGTLTADDLSLLKSEYSDNQHKWNEYRVKAQERANAASHQEMLEVALSLSPHVFYQLTEFDYRGRIYYRYPAFSPQGSDFAKAVREFAEPRPMTSDGFYWLLVSAANYSDAKIKPEDTNDYNFELDYKDVMETEGLESFPLDKMSLNDRVEWSLTNMEEILSTAEHGSLREDCDKPFLFLRTCMEIRDYTASQEAGESIYMSNYVCFVDATSNGFQHAAAINRDEATAYLCGLIDTPYQVDLYVKIFQEMQKTWPEEYGHIDVSSGRKNISKRAALCRQYSAGPSSISENIYVDMFKTRFLDKHDLDQNDCDRIANHSVKAIAKVCPAISSLQGYLNKLVNYELGDYHYFNDKGEDVHDTFKKLIGVYKKHKDAQGDDKELRLVTTRANDDIKEFKASHHLVLVYGHGSDAIRWTTPSGFKVISKLNRTIENSTKVQYKGRKHPKSNSKKSLDEMTRTRIHISCPIYTQTPDKNHHQRAITANYIHSNDSAHLQNIAATNKFTSFAAVHDSIGVHASDVECLLCTAKEEFVKIYPEDTDYYDVIRENILTEPDAYQPTKPRLGNLRLSDSLSDASYFFS